MATELRKLVEATASYMRFEQLCHRTELFSESYLAHPIGQFLLARHGSNVRSEWPHPILSEGKTGPGRRPAVDFAVLAEDRKTPAIAIEAKWLGSANDILEQIVRDIIRLELLVWKYKTEAYFLLAGTRRKADALFAKKSALPHPTQPGSHEFLPLGSGEQSWIRLENPAKFRQALIARAIRPFEGMNVDIPAGVSVSACGLFPVDAPRNQCCVIGWRVMAGTAARFRPNGAASTVE